MKGLLMFCVVALALPGVSFSYYTNANIASVTHTKPSWFSADEQGGFYGATEDGIAFSQRVVSTGFDIRLHKFSIGDAFFYISDRGIVWADNDLTAVSIYLARA